MKWSNEMVAKLRELATKGTSNKEIATSLGVSINDVYAKRSQLGITIDKVKNVPTATKAPEQSSDALFLWLLEQLLKMADSDIRSLELTRPHEVITIIYEGGKKTVNIECDSRLAIILDVVKKCLH